MAVMIHIPGDSEPDEPIPWTVYLQDVHTGFRCKLFREEPGPLVARHLLEWIPGRSLLLYGAGKPRRLYLLHPDGGRPERLLKEPPEEILWSRRVAYWVDEPTRSIRFATLPEPASVLSTQAGWREMRTYGPYQFPYAPGPVRDSPSGNQLVALIRKPAVSESSAWIVTINPRTRTARLLGFSKEWPRLWGWTEDEKYIVFHFGKVPVQSSPERRLADLDWKESISPSITPYRGEPLAK